MRILEQGVTAHTLAISLHQVNELGDEAVNQQQGAPADLIAQHVEKAQQVTVGIDSGDQGQASLSRQHLQEA